MGAMKSKEERKKELVQELDGLAREHPKATGGEYSIERA
jgi:hypothetical protein